MAEKKYCEFCYPQKIKGHTLRVVTELFTAPLFNKTKKKLSRMSVLSSKLPWWLVPLNLSAYFLSVIGFAVFKNEIDRTKFNNRSLAVYDAAKKLGLKPQAMYFFGKKPTNQMRVFFKNRIFYYFSVPLTSLCTDIDDKGILTSYLNKIDAPVPAGKIFWRRTSGLKYGVKLGFPLVVKPVRGSRSAHATYPINNIEELAHAVNIALKFEPRFFVQKYIPGFLHRFTVVDRQHVFCAKRLPPNVVGDGAHSIEQLIEEKNKNPKRAEREEKNSTLHKIPLDGVTQNFLALSGKNIKYIPKKDEFVQLGPKISIGSGGDLIEVTENINEKNIQLFKNIGAKLDVDIVGFDVMCKDISLPWDAQDFAIIEGNALPFLDFHEYPGEGTPKPVATLLWQSILKNNL